MKPFAHQIIKWTGLFILIAILGTAGYVGYLYYKVNKLMERVGTPYSVTQNSIPPYEIQRGFSFNRTDTFHEPLQKSLPQTENTPVKMKPVTFLLLGLDYRKKTRSLNSDVIMAVALNPRTLSATVVSIPRDLKMQSFGLPSRKANFYYPYFYIRDEESAFADTKQFYGDFLQLSLDHIVTFNFNGFSKIVDELGGVTVDVDMDMRYVDNEDGTMINLNHGMQKLNGKQTLDFVRYRKSNRGTAESSDYKRNVRQHQVLNVMLAKIKSFSGILKLGPIMDTVSQNVKMDIPPAQLRHYVATYLGIKQENIRYFPLQGEWISPYTYVREEEVQQARQALREQLGL
jgi:LCP family protein required for cell wall assembly